MANPEHSLYESSTAEWMQQPVVDALAGAITRAAALNNQVLDYDHPENFKVCDALFLLYREHKDIYPQGFEPMQVRFEDTVAGAQTSHIIAVKPGVTRDADMIACCSFAQLRSGKKEIAVDAREKGLDGLIVRRQTTLPDGKPMQVAMLIGTRAQLRMLGLTYLGGYPLKGTIPVWK